MCRAFILLFIAGHTFLFAKAQAPQEIPRSTNESTMIDTGEYNIKDTYLSPLKYTGWGIRVLNERMKMASLANYHISRQQLFNVEFSSTNNPSKTAEGLAGFIDYTLGYHYHFPLTPNFKLLTGASVRGMGGFIYNTRNSNNPATAKVDLDCNLSALAIYRKTIKDYPLTFRYQVTIPFIGVFFAQEYGQPYYEIFDAGNGKGVILFNSFHNKFAIKNYLTADFPIGILLYGLGTWEVYTVRM